jgi:hypothetical protein
MEVSRARHSPRAPSSPEWEVREATTPRQRSPSARARQLVVEMVEAVVMVETVAVVGRRSW